MLEAIQIKPVGSIFFHHWPAAASVNVVNTAHGWQYWGQPYADVSASSNSHGKWTVGRKTCGVEVWACVCWGIESFAENFHNEILLLLFPYDHTYYKSAGFSA